MINRFIFSLAMDSIKKAVPVPKVDYERCLNRRQKWQECTTCRDVCPKEGAITYNKQISIDPNLCNGCHLCHGLCPTHCILQQSSFIRGNDASDHDTLMIYCRPCGTDAAGINIPCVASLPWEFYAYSSYRGPISIMTQDCSQCGLDANKYIQDIHQRLRLFWGDDGYNAKILCHTKAPDAHYSRREMFGLFAGRAKAKTAVDVMMPEDASQSHPSLYRGLLLNALEEDAVHGWLTWEFGQACHGCSSKVCEKLCPSGAIKIEDEDAQRTITHNVLLCIGCRLCKTICPRKSIGDEQIVHMASKAQPIALNVV